MMENWIMDGGMRIWMLVNAVFWILVIVGIVLLVVWAIRRIEGNERSKVGETALEVLKKRYARGEITKEEYEEKKRDIS